MISRSGYPNMNHLGRKMKDDLTTMKHTGFPGSLDIDPKETSSSRYSETETSPPYVSKKFLNLIPSDVGLNEVLLQIPSWESLAVNLGVPSTMVQTYGTDPPGGLLALQYWRDGRCGELFPTTWRFLLEQVETISGKLVAEDLRRKASTEPTWSNETGKGKEERTAQLGSVHSKVIRTVSGTVTGGVVRAGVGSITGAGIGAIIGAGVLPVVGTVVGSGIGAGIGAIVGFMPGLVLGGTGAGTEPGKGKEEKTAQQDSVRHGVQMNHEEDLLRLCWIPFGIQTLTVDPQSDDHTFLLQPNTGGCGKDDLIRLEIPKGAINTTVCEELSIRYGILVHGPFVLEDDYELVSMVVYIYFNPDHTTKPLILHLPHWGSKEETTTVVFAPHEAKGGYNFTKLNENILLPSTAMFSVPIYGHSTLFARAIKIKARRAFFAIPVESQKETVTTLSVYFTFASQVWHDIIDEYLIDDDHQSQSPLPCDLDENEIIPRLEEDKGAGWEAQCTRTFKIISKHILYESNGIRNKKQLENAVCVSKSYPPYVQCEVKCTREAKMGGQTRRVPLAFRRRGESDGGLKITCTTYSQETIGGSKPDMGDNQPDGAIQVKKPTSTIPAPQPQEQQPIDQPLGSQPEPDPFRKVQARDVIALLNWKELVRDIRSMLTKSRVQTLKRSCGLINDTCAREIGQNLVGDPDSAATTLIEYFEENHSGSELMKFCGFLREEADQAGLASTLIDLAKKIEDAVKRTPSKGS